MPACTTPRALFTALRAAIAACGLATGGWAGAAAAGQMAITFDDLPAHSALPPGESRMEVAQSIIGALRDAGATEVYGFANAGREPDEPGSVGVLSAWRAAGFPLGNHAWSHMNLDTSTLADWQADVVRNEALLKAQMGPQDWRWLRFPFLAEGETAQKRAGARAFLLSRGYRIAQVTMSFADYAFNEPYARCMAKGDVATVQRMETTYLAAAADETRRARAMSQALLGREIPYVLLMHLGAFDARMLPRLLAQYKAEGMSFVTLPQAQADPFYAPDMDLRMTGPDMLEWALAARGQSAPKRQVDITWLERACRP